MNPSINKEFLAEVRKHATLLHRRQSYGSSSAHVVFR
jgi:hypothetical protein